MAAVAREIEGPAQVPHRYAFALTWVEIKGT
jgi:hypothetical protein